MPAPSRRGRARLGGALLASLFALGGCMPTGFSDVTASVASSATGVFSSKPVADPIPVTLFVASTRKDDRSIAGEFAGDLHYGMATISVPGNHVAGVIETPTFGSPKVGRHFTLTDAHAVSRDTFANSLATHLSGRVGVNRDVLLYVHGFANSLSDARLRLTQIVVDARFGGAPVLFTWPSASSVFSYVSDKDRATASRDALEQVMRDLAGTPGVGRVHVLAHSMGAFLAMEALRENAIAGDPSLGGKLGDVMLAAPDIDLAVFRQQMARLGSGANVSVFVSRADRALSLSSQIAGDRKRVGAMDPTNPADEAELQRLGVKVFDLTSLSSGFIGHAVYADAPSVMRSIGAQLAEPRKEDATAVAVLNAAPEAAKEPPPATVETVTSSPLPPPATQ